MPEVTVIYWRDIPAQVLVKQGRQRQRHPLSKRFQQGIDRAAMRAKKVDMDAYLEDWHRESARCEGDIEALLSETARRIEQEYDELRLERIIRNHGLEPGRTPASEGAA